MPIIDVQAHMYHQQVDGPTIAQTRDRFTEVQLRTTIGGWLAARPAPRYFTLHSPPFDLQSYIDKYSEQVTADPIQDLRKFFTATAIVGTTYGGVPTGSRILAYRPKNVRANIAAIAAVGEGLAGWFMEDVERLSWVVRPSGVSPDFIFEDVTTGRFALVEVKSSLKGDIGTEVKKGALSVLDVLAKTKLIRPARYLAYVLGVVIEGVDRFVIHCLRMEEV